MSTEETSLSGDPVYRYEEADRKQFTAAHGDADNIEDITDHIEAFIGPVEMVFHEIVSDLVHIDVHWVKASENFPVNVLVTSGMSDMPMNIPEGLDVPAYMELCVLLPKEWPMDQASWKDEKNYWPIRWLKHMARFPHQYDTWLGYGHTLPNGEHADPYAENTKLGCMILLPSISLPEGFRTLRVSADKSICFYCLYPLYREEMEFKLAAGSHELLNKFAKNQIGDIIDINRKNTCVRKKWFGRW
ncbi:MAG: suppressor of fused domain protein [Bacteroidetes bacterium]|nr:suppressor of fused domain protein [Bacteroidota bacterium]